MPLLPPLNPPISHWTGRRIWLVGASSGIGAAVARELAARGAHLALSARREAALVALREALPAAAREHCRIVPCDITDLQDVTAAAHTLLSDGGGLDLVFMAAGVYDALSPREFDLLSWPVARQTLDTNLTGAYHLLAAVLPALRRQGHGGLAFVSSVAGLNGLPRALAYAPGKAALNNLCEGLYLELRPLGLSVYRICPGFVATPMTAGVAFPMPALLSAEAAAGRIVRGLERGDFDIHFPKRFTLLLHVLRCLPRRFYFRIMQSVLQRL